MADEHDEPDEPDEHDEHDEPGDIDMSDDAADGDLPVAGTPPTSDDDGTASTAELNPAGSGAQTPAEWSRRFRNMMVPGRLVFHHYTRDVTINVDGDAALRVIAYFAHRDGDPELDRLIPNTSSAAFGWVSFDLDGVIGITWSPDPVESDRATRVVFDPVAPTR